MRFRQNREKQLGRVKHKSKKSTTKAKSRKPKKITSNLSYRVAIRRNLLTLQKRRSTSFRLL